MASSANACDYGFGPTETTPDVDTIIAMPSQHDILYDKFRDVCWTRGGRQGMNKEVRLLIDMIMKSILGFFLLGLVLFGCAGTLQYANAWLFIGSLFALVVTMGVVLLVKYPQTLERRLKSKEREGAQKGYIAIMGILFSASFALAGFDHRFQWTELSFWVSLVALIPLFVGYGLFGAVTLQNSYASRVVEVQKDQTVVSTGLYAVVRHPMYLASLLLFLSIPFVLGSLISLIPMLIFPIVLILRIKNEEALLMSGLEGYPEYVRKTRYRLIPHIW